MATLSSIKDYINSLDDRQLRNVILGFLGLLLLSIGYLIYRKYSISSEFHAQLVGINKQRKRAQNILQRNNELKKQREEVNALLDEDKNFRLLDYFNKLTQELHLNPLSSPVVSAPHDLGIGYNEVELNVSFNNINMKQLTDLLERIEKTARIYAKELIIDKSQKSPTIDIKLTIATLEPGVTA